jgi:hypothetical protein
MTGFAGVNPSYGLPVISLRTGKNNREFYKKEIHNCMTVSLFRLYQNKYIIKVIIWQSICLSVFAYQYLLISICLSVFAYQHFF